MTWVYLDDKFPDHPKVLQAGDDAAWLFVAGLCYANRNGTIGSIPRAAVARLTGRKEPMKLASVLVDVGLWDVDGADFTVHNYAEWNHSAVGAATRREKARKAAQTRFGKAKGSSATDMPGACSEHARSMLGACPEECSEHAPHARARGDAPSPSPIPLSVVEDDGCTDLVPLAADGGEGLQRLTGTVGKPRRADVVWDALCEACGINPAEITKSLRGSLNAARSQLVSVGATPAEILLRAGRHRRKWPNASVTAASLAKNWAMLAADVGGGQSRNMATVDAVLGRLGSSS